jgi:hypothetical protein
MMGPGGMEDIRGPDPMGPSMMGGNSGHGMMGR